MDPVQQIKERLSVVEVVGQYVKLTRAGKNYKGLSPFKKEKTPSFYVSPDKGMYYDFSTNQGGDIFTFVQAMEGLDFRGALTMLAERAGVQLREERGTDRDARARLYAVLEDACAYFETQLLEHTQARAYLNERGVLDTTMRSFRLGFAPDDWQQLTTFLMHRGYTEPEVETAGLCKRSEHGRPYDRFRSRIMFPLSDSAGRVIAFSGRIFGTAALDEKNAKYMNSPETPLFDKGRVLYGYDKAKSVMREQDRAILVEGQMDLVMSHQAGCTETVAVSGTGLTEHHLGLIHRITERIILALDADAAGVASTMRTASLALDLGMDTRVATVPFGKDPADCILHDADVWRSAISGARHVVDHFLDHAFTRNRTDGSGDARSLILSVRDTVLPLVARIRSATDQAHFVHTIANALGIGEDAVMADVRAVQRDPAPTTHLGTPPATPPPTPTAALPRKQSLEQSIAGVLFWQAHDTNTTSTTDMVSELSRTFDVALEPILARHDTARDVLALQAELAFAERGAVELILRELMRDLARVYRAEERETLMQSIRAAERSNDDALMQQLLADFQQLSKRIDALDKRT